MVAAIWLVVPPTVLSLLQATTGAAGLVTRYWLFSLPALAILAAYALASFRPRSRTGALVCLAVLVGLGIPSQVLLREVDGHLGQGWLDFPAVLALPALRTAPLITASWNYHGLISNDRALAGRIPLVRNPDRTGRIIPQLAGPGSAPFRALIHADSRVVVLATARTASSALPTIRSFRGFHTVLRNYPVPAATCTWFGQPLGIFTTRHEPLTAPQERALARQITAIAPADVHCASRLSH